MNPLLSAMKSDNMNAFRLVQMLKNRNPQDVFNEMLQNNPAFRKFVSDNKGKTPEQFAREHGADLTNLLQQYR